MAKIKSTITDFNELEKQFKELAKTEANILVWEARMNEAVLHTKTEFQRQINPKIVKRNSLENEIRLFCQENKKEFEGANKTRKFTWGTVGFRLSSKGAIKILRKVKNAFREAAKNLFDIYGTQYVKMVPEIEKDKLSADYRSGKFSDTQLANVNLRFDKEPEFFYKFDFRKFEKDTGIKVPVKKAAKGEE